MSAGSPLRRGLLALLAGALAAAWVAGLLALWDTRVPGDLKPPALEASDYIAPALAERAGDYQAILDLLALGAMAAQLAVLAAFALKGPAFVRESAAGRIGTGMLLGMLAMGISWLARFPFTMGALWWERRHDLTEAGYVEAAINDWLSAGGTFLHVSLALLIVMLAAARWPRRWWVAAIPALLAIGLLATYTQPYLMPSLERPRDPELVAQAERLAAVQGTGAPRVRIQETAGITPAPNAGATGLGASETVILWDNLVEGFSAEQARFVVAHEVAHLARDHVRKSLALLALLAIPIGLLATAATRGRGGLARPEAVPVAILVVAVSLAALGPLRSAYSQRFEEEADWIALETTRDPDAAIAALSDFTREALAAPERSGWASALETHPGVTSRIEMAEAWRMRAGSGPAGPALGSAGSG